MKRVVSIEPNAAPVAAHRNNQMKEMPQNRRRLVGHDASTEGRCVASVGGVGGVGGVATPHQTNGSPLQHDNSC